MSQRTVVSSRKDRPDAQANDKSPVAQSSSPNAREDKKQAESAAEEPTIFLDAVALLLGLTVVALLFKAVVPQPYMVSSARDL